MLRSSRILYTAVWLTTFAQSNGNRAFADGHAPFRENKGQVHDQSDRARPDVLFSGSAAGLVYHVMADGISYQLNRVDAYREPPAGAGRLAHVPNGQVPTQTQNVPDRITTYRVDIRFIGADGNNRPVPSGMSSDHDNYYTAAVPDGATFVKSYDVVRFMDLYPGVGIKWYRGADGQLKYDLEVEAGADAGAIRFRASGADNVWIDDQGGLNIGTPLGTIREERPVILQDGRSFAGRWVVSGDEVSFDLGTVARDRPFTIDPAVRVWGTYLYDDVVLSTAGDANIVGEVTVSGLSIAVANLATTGAHQTVHGGGQFDAIVTKLDRDGVRQWTTYVGGEFEEYGGQSAITNEGKVYLTGSSLSYTAIATPGSHQESQSGASGQGMVVKFDANGVREWGTYYSAGINACAVNENDELVVTGTTINDVTVPFIASAGAHQPGYGGGNQDAFVAKFDGSGARQWGTYLGGASTDYGVGCAISADGTVHVTGITSSANGFSTTNGHQQTHTGGEDAFLVRFDAAGVRLWGTYYGSAGTSTEGMDCAAMADGGVVWVGRSVHFLQNIPAGVFTTPGAHQVAPAVDGVSSGLIVRFDASGARQWGTLYGAASGSIDVHFCDVGDDDNIYFVGFGVCTAPDAATAAQNSLVLTTACAHQPQFETWLEPGSASVMYAPLLGSFSGTGTLRWATWYGGRSMSSPSGGAWGGDGRFYMMGAAQNPPWHMQTYGPDLASEGTEIATPNSFQPTIQDNLSMDGDATNMFVVQFVEPSVSHCTDVIWTPDAWDAVQWFDCTSGTIVPGATSPTFTLGQAGSYALIVSHDGCVDTSACRSVALLDELSTGPDQFITPGGSTVLNASGGSLDDQYAWSPPDGLSCTVCPDPVATPATTTTYCVRLVGASSCTDNACVTVTVQSPEAVAEHTADRSVGHYPTPTSTGFTVFWNGRDALKGVEVVLYDMMGRMVRRVPVGAGDTSVWINTQDFASGQYTYQLRTATHVIGGPRLVVAH